MYRLNILGITLLLVLTFSTGGTAYGVCDPSDGNNNEANAASIGMKTTISDVVCPDDPFDYYMLVIPDQGAISGDVTFSSPQASTVIRVYESVSGDRIIDDVSTSDNVGQHNFPVPAGILKPGTYYLRVFFWSAAAYDHEYTLTLNLEVELPPDPGEGNDPRGPKVHIMKFNPVLAAMATSPWPSNLGHADNARRAKGPGPGAGMIVRNSIDLFDGILTWREHHQSANPMSSGWDETHWFKQSDRKAGFHKLLVGPHNRLHFRISPEPMRTVSYSFDIDDGQQWVGGEFRDSRMDAFGNLYLPFFNLYAYQLYSYDTAGEERWVKLIPEAQNTYGLGLIGRKIYATGGYYPGSTGEGEYYEQISAFNTAGDVSWTTEPIYGDLQGMTEDASGNFYIRDVKENLYKINSDGEIVWTIRMPSHEYSYGDPQRKKGPIAGSDGRIWAGTYLWSNESETEYVGGITPGDKKKIYVMKNGPVYVVTNSDGTPYKYGKFGGEDKTPQYVCHGSNNTLCVAFQDQTITGYTDWDVEQWTWERTEMEGIKDILMDSNNKLYVCFSAWGIQTMGVGTYIAVLDSKTGQQLSLTYVDIPEQWANVHCELAIGEDNTLILLNAAGYLKVYAPKLQIPSRVIKLPETGGLW